MTPPWARMIVLHIMKDVVPHGFKWEIGVQASFETGRMETQVHCSFERVGETRPIHEDITPRQAERLAKAMVHRVLMRLNPPRPDQAVSGDWPNERYQKGWRDPRTLSPAELQAEWDRQVHPAPCGPDSYTREDVYAAVRKSMDRYR